MDPVKDWEPVSLGSLGRTLRVGRHGLSVGTSQDRGTLQRRDRGESV